MNMRDVLIRSVLLHAGIGLIIWILGVSALLSAPVIWIALGLQMVLVGWNCWVGGRVLWRVQGSHTEHFLCIILGIQALIYVPGVLLPEIGFDALWYHLPIMEVIRHTQRVVVIDELYQSVQPILGNLMFLPAYAVGGVVAAKLAVYCSMVYLITAVYALSRSFLSRVDALTVCVIVLGLHTVSWQSSSVYVDLLRTVYELCALIVIVDARWSDKRSFLVGTLLGISLLIKAVSLVFVPAFLIALWSRRGMRSALIAGGSAGALFLPVQLYGLVETGSIPALSLYTQVGNDLVGSSLSAWASLLIKQGMQLLLLPLTLTRHTESYLTPIFLWAVPFIGRQWRYLLRTYQTGALFALLSLATWLCIVPVSVRYNLPGIIALLILCILAIRACAWSRLPLVAAMTWVIIALGIVPSLGIRLFSLYRAKAYLLGQQTEQAYVQQFDNPIIHGPLLRWYSGYWHNR